MINGEEDAREERKDERKRCSPPGAMVNMPSYSYSKDLHRSRGIAAGSSGGTITKYHLQQMSALNVQNSVAPEPEGSSPYSQEPVAGPYPEPNGSTPHSPIQSP
jgi:hypothetical protein